MKWLLVLLAFGAQIPEQRQIHGRPIFVVSGQSNAAPLAESLAHWTLTRFVGLGGAPISLWDTQPRPRYLNDFQWLWPDLAAVLSYRPMPDAFIWVQGESDATADLLPHYEAAARDLFRRVRALTKPDLLIVVVGVPDYVAKRPQWDAMRVIQQRLVQDDPHALYFSTLPYVNGGGQHYASPEYARIAEAVFTVARERLGRTPPCVYDNCFGAVVPPWKPKP